MSAASAGYATVRDIVRAEYGDSKNPMTPDIITVGGVLDGPAPWACEIASGSGILPGTSIVGVSVVLVLEDGSTTRLHDFSTSFHGTDINALIDEALDYMRTLDPRIRQQHEAALVGRVHGANAGSWVIDGNTSEDTARRILQGIEDGDPEILDMLPSTPLSGEWADGLTPEMLITRLEEDTDTDVHSDDREALLDAYEAAYRDGVEAAVVSACHATLGEVTS